AYTGARLASGDITFEEVGPAYDVEKLIVLDKPEPSIKDGAIYGNIDILQVRFGNLWTNIDRHLFYETGIEYGYSHEMTIENNTRHVYININTFSKSFGDSNHCILIININS